ncbi:MULTISPECIES: phosphomannomutase [unclassified Aureimonas]|uniref:phosphomannomutase n=1 Tax=unclassified Aureimonas TaxID=2615206 RepID=UPI0006F526DE|nr:MULTISPECIES: phosphomannomutase [unclassified Aureimonas]KQT62047.1 phosphomannomutase [Aureimonas sp. Leaf460]KQT69578.1 phosphomannomutase [Aureimonas sp. Leaf427]
MTSLKFGTSGLRGLVEDLVGPASAAYTKAFLAYLEGSPSAAARTVLIGRDLRSSSSRIAGDCGAAARAVGWTVIDCGALPTPALALESLGKRAPAIMVTGSHIPDDRNGLKFYTADGEITKADEEGILGALGEIGADGSADAQPLPATGSEVIDRYIERYRAAFGSAYLQGLAIGVYQHSTVARDVLVQVVEALGAKAVPFARSDLFIPVDTEAHRPEDIAILAEFAAGTSVDAIISADGDADRPLVADAAGRVLRGDTLGLITALALGVSAIVTPVTSASRIEAAAAHASVRRTRVGSPFVLAGMEEAAKGGASGVLGFEANGGVLLGTPVLIEGRVLPALPTRDAILPIVAVLGEVRSKALPLADIVSSLRLGFAAADRLKAVPSEIGARLAQRLLADPAYAADFFADVGTIAEVDRLDGARFVFENGAMVHYRPSGNAPELRCYVEADSEAAAADLLKLGLGKAADFVRSES